MSVPSLGATRQRIEERPAGFERKRGLCSFPSLPTLMSCFSKILTLPGYVLDIQDIQDVRTVYSTPECPAGLWCREGSPAGRAAKNA